MGEGQTVGVQKLALDTSGPGEGVGTAVEGIAGDRATGGGGVDADLVGAAGKQSQFQQGCPGPGADDFPVGAGGPASGADRHFLAMDGMASDGAFPGTDLASGASQNKGEIGFLGFPVLELAAEFAMGGIGFGGHEDAGGFQIEPVNDPGTIRTAAGGELARAVVQKGRGEGTGGSTGAGMNGEAGGFVEDDDVGVLVEDLQRDGFGLHVPRGRRGNADGEAGTGGEKIPGLHGLARGFDTAGFHPLLDLAAGFAAEAGEDEVGPLMGIAGADGAAPDPFLGRGGFSARLLGMTSHAWLILPFFCSLVYAIGALLLKRSMEAGHSPREAMVASNLALALFSLPLLVWAKPPPAGLAGWMWGAAPACSMLFFLGQICTFRAISGGDVSVATPIFGTKVVMTALFGALFLPGGVGSDLWVGAFLCTAGVALVGMQPGVRRGKALRAVGWGLGSAAVFSLTDVIVARAAPEIGFCLFGPWMMLGMAVMSVWVVPPGQWGRILYGGGRRWGWGGAFLIGVQGTFLYASIALSGDPVGVNIVYAVRGLWSVILVAWIGKWLGNREAGSPRSVLVLRGVGALLLVAAVWAVLG
jgi:drug/metabolite transporter (DMT)-like permease